MSFHTDCSSVSAMVINAFQYFGEKKKDEKKVFPINKQNKYLPTYGNIIVYLCILQKAVVR